MIRALALGLAMVGMMPAISLSQEGLLGFPILVLDQDRLFLESGRSDRVDTEFQRRLQALGEENQRLSAELEAEELRLTELRPTTDPTEFRAMADAFDEKVQALRAEQDAKEAELLEFNEQSQIQFQRQVLPIVTAILRERGAVLLIDRRSAVVVADAIDITDEAIERVNAALDATLPLGVPVPAPEAPPSVEGLPFGVPEVSPDPSASPGDAPGVGDDARP